MKQNYRIRRKILGQHFLKDENIAEQIVSFAKIVEDETVLEIGPGKGILTSFLLKKSNNVIAVEIDEKLAGFLQKRFAQYNNLQLIHKNFLDYEIPNFPDKIKVIGNLPYNVGKRIILYLISCRDRLSEMIFMLQKEVAERLAASHGAREYGSLSIFAQLYYDVDILMNIDPESFSPPPKVLSSIVVMKPKKPPFNKFDNQELFQRIVRLAFSTRRKKLKNTLKPVIANKEDMNKISKETGIDFDLRGEVLSIEQYLELAKTIDRLY